MNKKFKIIIGIIVGILLLYLTIFVIDYNRCSNMKEPIFVVKKQENDLTLKAITYQGLGYRVEVEKMVSAKYGPEITKVEMYILDKFITGAIAETNNNEVIDESNSISEINSSSQVHNSFVGTVVEETTTYMIVEPNEDENERRSADRIRINYGTDHIDYLYGIGRKVIINYTGYIKETYPAQIDTDNILINGYEEFELSVKESDSKIKKKILNNLDLYKDNSDFDLYYYGLDEVNVTVDNKMMSLEVALRSGKMTIDGILARANQDESAGKIKSEMYRDGGTTEWYYDTYTIIKCHSLDGNRDVYIGVPEMRLKNIK